MKRAIISYQNGVGRYQRGQQRLVASLQYNGHSWSDGFTIISFTQNAGFTSHAQSPYQFKIDAFRTAFARGFESVIYVDCSVVAMQPIQPVFEHIEKHGYIMQYAGHMVGRWTNDRALEYFGVNRDDAMHMPMYGNAGFLGLNVHDATAMKFFELWEQSARDGMFRGQWHNNNRTESNDGRCDGHRHDMSCGSIIANQLNMVMQPGDEWLHYQSPDVEPAINVYFHAQGM